MLVVVTIFSKLGSEGASNCFTASFLESLVVVLVGLALDISSLAIGLGDDFEDFDFELFNFRFFGFFSSTRLSHGSVVIKSSTIICNICCTSSLRG